MHKIGINEQAVPREGKRHEYPQERKDEHMREKEIEQALVTATRRKGGLCLKVISPSMTGLPDRMILLPTGRCGFAELKAPGKKPRPLQERRLKQLKGLGFYVTVIDGKAQIEETLEEINAQKGTTT